MTTTQKISEFELAKVRKQYSIPVVAPKITFSYSQPKCPECDSIEFLDLGFLDYYECANSECKFAFDGQVGWLNYGMNPKK